MPNIVDYVRRASRPFTDLAPTRVDSLVFSCLAYFPLPAAAADARGPEGMRLAQLCDPDWLVAMAGSLHDPADSLDLLGCAAASPRFSGVRVCEYVSETNDFDPTQFSAMTFRLPGGGAFVAFRGTDGSLAGWKEDFDMAFSSPVPAQGKARGYLERVAGSAGGPVWVGGHSKGGNLAVYAAMTASPAARARVRRVFSHDGPGFLPETLDDPSWAGDAALVDKTVPVDSFVGLIFGTSETDRVTVVRCDDVGVLQHAPLRWVVEDGDFVVEPSISYGAHRQARRFNAWVRGMDAQGRERFVEALYTLVRRMGIRSFSDISSDVPSFAARLLASLDLLEGRQREEFSAALEDLASTMLLGPASDYARDDTPHGKAERGSVRVEESAARFYDIMRDLERRTGTRL